MKRPKLPKPADNIKLAEMELKVDRGWKLKPTPSQGAMLQEIQSLIERIKMDDKKIRQLEDMKGIAWKGQKTGHEDG
jgi:hypothetical protein